MRSVYAWYAARLVLILAVSGGVRYALALVANAQLGAATESVELAMGSPGGDVPIGLPGMGEGPPPTGDAGRADQPISDDLDQPGQVVMRDGKLYVLIDGTDPDHEVLRPLNPEPEPADLAAAFLTGWGALCVSIGAGVTVFALSLAVGPR